MNILKRIWRVVSTVLVAVAVVFAVALVGVRLVGFEVFTVLSGSMEPAYRVGSVIWVDECEPEEVQVGDPITFVLNEDLVVATHRVIEIDPENQHFYTKGDANDAPDAAPVHFENLIGKPVFTVPYLGYFVSYIQQPPGLYVAIAACAFLLLLMFLPELFGKEGADAKTVSRTQPESNAGAMRGNQTANAGRHAPQRSDVPHCSQSAHARRAPQQARAPQRAPSTAANQVNNPRLRRQSSTRGRIDNQRGIGK